jgi:hypothetical protein
MTISMPTSRTSAVYLAFVCLLLSLNSRTAWPQQEQPRSVEDTDEYAVYSAILNAKYFHVGLKRYVIAVDTNSSAKNAFIGYRAGLAPSGAKRPEVEQETSTDFDVKNKESYVLTSRFTLDEPYTLVTEAELKKIFLIDDQGKVDKECWHNFYKQYPGASGIFAFSRVGLNSKKDQAFVYVVNQADFLAGSGVLYVLSKRQNTWKVDNGVILWLS